MVENPSPNPNTNFRSSDSSYIYENDRSWQG